MKRKFFTFLNFLTLALVSFLLVQPGMLAGTKTRAAQKSPDPLLDSEEAVIINIDNPVSEEIAGAYLRIRPNAHVVRIELGNNDQISDLNKVAVARNKINSELPASVKTLALCFARPSRVGSGDGTGIGEHFASINFALTHEWTSSSSVNGVWNPNSRVAGFVPTVDLVNNSAISHRNGQVGTVYAMSAWDAPPRNPRGNTVRQFAEPLSQGNPALPSQFNFEWINNMSNSSDQHSWGNNFIRNKTDMIGYFMGVGNRMEGLKTNTVLRGAICDNVTSYGGRLGETHGQESIMSWINHGFIFGTGSVSEPGGGGSLVEKFVDGRLALPLWLGGSYAAEVYKASVKNPVRNLGIFCPFVAPYYKVSETDPNEPMLSLTPAPTQGAGEPTAAPTKAPTPTPTKAPAPTQGGSDSTPTLTPTGAASESTLDSASVSDDSSLEDSSALVSDTPSDPVLADSDILSGDVTSDQPQVSSKPATDDSDAQESENDSEGKSPAKKTDIVLIVLGAAVGLLAVAAAVLYFVKRGK